MARRIKKAVMKRRVTRKKRAGGRVRNRSNEAQTAAR